MRTKKRGMKSNKLRSWGEKESGFEIVHTPGPGAGWSIGRGQSEGSNLG